MFKRERLTSLVISSTAAMIALTGCALYLVERGEQLWPMVLGSSCATLLVMSMLHGDLQRLYALLAQKESEAHSEARLDPLTGLANRKCLLEALRLRLANNVGHAALVLLDLDYFKRVNDTRGHQVGDELLSAIARRLEDAVPDALIARLGGDEFALLVELPDPDDVHDLCQVLVSSFEEPFNLSHGECFARGSLGAAFLEPDLDSSQVLRRADVALYRAKVDRARSKIFDRKMIEAVERRARLAEDLRRIAGSGNGLTTLFQPMVSRDGAIVRAEALLRWQHPELGNIPPQEVISVAEEVQLINELGMFVAEQACDAAIRAPDLVIAVNASVVQLLDPRFVSRFQELVRRKGVSAKQIQIELKDADVAGRSQEIADALNELCAAGFVIAVDDFGSSSSSLAHVSRLGVTVLKLDGSVLQGAREPQNLTILRAKVELAKAHNMTVICGGVATEADQLAALRAGCDMLQGFRFSPPVKLETILKSAQRLRAA